MKTVTDFYISWVAVDFNGSVIGLSHSRHCNSFAPFLYCGILVCLVAALIDGSLTRSQLLWLKPVCHCIMHSAYAGRSDGPADRLSSREQGAGAGAGAQEGRLGNSGPGAFIY